MAQDGDEYVEVKLKTQWGRRKALKIYQKAVRKRNIKIEDLQVEVQRLRALLTEQQLALFENRYANEDRTGKRNADKKFHRHGVWGPPRNFTDAEAEALDEEMTPEQREELETAINDALDKIADASLAAGQQ